MKLKKDWAAVLQLLFGWNSRAESQEKVGNAKRNGKQKKEDEISYGN